MTDFSSMFTASPTMISTPVAVRSVVLSIDGAVIDRIVGRSPSERPDSTSRAFRSVTDSLVTPGHPSTPGYNDPEYPFYGRRRMARK